VVGVPLTAGARQCPLCPPRQSVFWPPRISTHSDRPASMPVLTVPRIRARPDRPASGSGCTLQAAGACGQWRANVAGGLPLPTTPKVATGRLSAAIPHAGRSQENDYRL